MSGADMEIREALGLYRRYLTLKAEIAAMEWNDTARIDKGTAELAAMSEALGLPIYPSDDALGLYFGGEDLCSVWMPGEVEPWPFVFAALNYVAREMEPGTSFGPLHNAVGLTYAFGAAILDPLFDIADDIAASIHRETRRFEISIDGDDDGNGTLIFATPDQAKNDERFDEAGFAPCEPGQPCCTLVTVASVDIEALSEFVEARDEKARRALRGELG